jgi:hypothetical protein
MTPKATRQRRELRSVVRALLLETCAGSVNCTNPVHARARLILRETRP